MIHVQDEQSLERMLGSPVPQAALNECEVRLRMYHSDGNSGPLGSIALVDMVRHLGFGPKHVEEVPEVVEWRNMDQDGSVRVEFKEFGYWHPGVFLGFVEGGTLAIRSDDSQDVKEVRREFVRLPVDEPVQEDPMGPEPMRAELLRKEEALAASDTPVTEDVVPVEEETSPIESADPIEDAAPVAEAASIDDDAPIEDMGPMSGEPEETGNEAVKIRPGTEVDWTEVPPGTSVWVQDGDEVRDAVFDKVTAQAGDSVIAVAVTVEGDSEPSEFTPAVLMMSE